MVDFIQSDTLLLLGFLSAHDTLRDDGYLNSRDSLQKRGCLCISGSLFSDGCLAVFGTLFKDGYLIFYRHALPLRLTSATQTRFIELVVYPGQARLMLKGISIFQAALVDMDN